MPARKPGAHESGVSPGWYWTSRAYGPGALMVARGEPAGPAILTSQICRTGIPQSAHGTNPASAVMAGMQVVVVKTDPQGNVDVADLRAKA